jgi:hypothetical protein
MNEQDAQVRMSNADRLAEFSSVHLGGRGVPPDLAILLEIQWSEAAADLFANLGFRFWNDAGRSPLLDMSYLNDTDRANPDIMANVAATQDVFAFIVFVGEARSGNAYGYWFGPDDRSIEKAPIVRYDTEGQFSIRRGRILAEALLADLGASDADEFLALSHRLNQFGLNITAKSRSDLKFPEVKPGPADVHIERYNVHRAAAGLAPFKK